MYGLIALGIYASLEDNFQPNVIKYNIAARMVVIFISASSTESCMSYWQCASGPNVWFTSFIQTMQNETKYEYVFSFVCMAPIEISHCSYSRKKPVYLTANEIDERAHTSLQSWLSQPLKKNPRKESKCKLSVVTIFLVTFCVCVEKVGNGLKVDSLFG